MTLPDYDAHEQPYDPKDWHKDKTTIGRLLAMHSYAQASQMAHAINMTANENPMIRQYTAGLLFALDMAGLSR